MCNKKTWNDTISDVDISLGARVFIDNQIIKDSGIVDRVIEKVLNSGEYFVFLLQPKIDIFKYSIVSGHMKWISDDLYNPGEVPFAPYNENSLKDQARAYCIFYEQLVQDEDILVQHEVIRETLVDYFNALSKMYCH